MDRNHPNFGETVAGIAGILLLCFTTFDWFAEEASEPPETGGEESKDSTPGVSIEPV